MAREGRTENLRPFKPGEDSRRNKDGRPRKLPALDKLLADVLGHEEGAPEESSKAKLILSALYAKAKRGDVRAAEILLDRAYGKAKQHVDITSQGKSIKEEVDYSKLSDSVLRAVAAAGKPETSKG